MDAAAASGRYDQVVVTGHSLGGAMAQLYTAGHADQVGGVTYGATTFGSPGAILPAGEDARVTNFVIADDPAVALGAHAAVAAFGVTLTLLDLVAGGAAVAMVGAGLVRAAGNLRTLGRREPYAAA